MNLPCVLPVRDSAAQSAIKPGPSWSLHPGGSVRIARVPGVFIAGSPAGQNRKVSTIDQDFIYQENFASVLFGITHSSNLFAKYRSVMPAMKSRTSSAFVAVSR
jgi:hypothetical protein